MLPTDYYQKSDGIWLDKSGDTTYMKELVDSSPEIKVVGILRPNEEAAVTSVSSTIGYTHELTEYVIEEVNKTEIAQEQLASPDVNIFTGLPFSDSNDKFSIDQLTDEQKAYLATLSQEELSLLLTQYSENANASYEDNLLTLGVVDIDKPSSIRIYPKDFDSKEEIIQIIEDYNQDKESSGNEADVIRYTDIVGVMMSSVSTIIDTISYILIAFVAISLIVSSIMIGIITYISVLERTKEIGILRAIGASKKDVSRVFNAETFIEGLVAGTMGILITVLLNIPINMIIKHVVGISGIASLPVVGAIILVIISMILTVIAGLVPSRMASKKDPVEALRTE